MARIRAEHRLDQHLCSRLVPVPGQCPDHQRGCRPWFAETLVGRVTGLQDHPMLILLVMSGAAAAVRAVMTNITGYLAFIIPVAMSTGAALGLNPVVCGLVVVVVGDSVVYYPAGSASGVFIFQRAELRAPGVLRLGLIMTAITIGLLFTVVLPYWSIVGESLTT
ncbi:MAG: hypothetical protein BZY86_06610 [SAR202 cluster bacterium MP-NPac-SRR3961935-G1]|nr:MAG: hypothetical protein BZY86_06610 [SAR202 cluster bacterium MP-NPac-SRR3961935-G1]